MYHTAVCGQEEVFTSFRNAERFTAFCPPAAVWERKGSNIQNVIVPVVLYGCETWSVTLREGHRLRVFENRVLRGIFGPKGDEGTGEWRKLHNGELHNLYSSPDVIRQIKSRRMRWAGHVARVGEGRNVYRVFGGEARRKETT
jgi:hypothetical protein